MQVLCNNSQLFNAFRSSRKVYHSLAAGIRRHVVFGSHNEKADHCQQCLSCLKQSSQQSWDTFTMDPAAFGLLSLEDNVLRQEDKPFSLRTKQDPQPTADDAHSGCSVASESEKQAVIPKKAPLHGNAKTFKSVSRLDPTAPSYQPMLVSPLGSSQPSFMRSTPGFIPYQPIGFTVTASIRSISTQERGKLTSSLRPIEPRNSSPVGSPPKSKPAIKFQKPTAKVPKSVSDRSAKLARPIVTFSSSRLPMPIPTADYLFQALSVPRRISNPQSLLVVLDLNGTLLARRRHSTNITPRPCLDKFLRYCLENHTVMIWSSAQPASVDRICHQIFQTKQRLKILREWARDTLDLTKEDYYEKVQVYKRLDRIWDNGMLRSQYSDFNNHKEGLWSQANTVLIDDSLLKARKQPYNHIEVPEYTLESKAEGGMQVLSQVVGYLEELRKWEDVSCFIKGKGFKVNSGWVWDWKKDQAATSDI